MFGFFFVCSPNEFCGFPSKRRYSDVCVGAGRQTKTYNRGGTSLSPAIIKVNRNAGGAGQSYAGARTPARVCEVAERADQPLRHKLENDPHYVELLKSRVLASANEALKIGEVGGGLAQNRSTTEEN